MPADASSKGKAGLSGTLKVAGRALVIVGLALVALTAFFVSGIELQEWGRLGGLSLVVAGCLSYVVDRLALSRPDRQPDASNCRKRSMRAGYYLGLLGAIAGAIVGTKLVMRFADSPQWLLPTIVCGIILPGLFLVLTFPAFVRAGKVAGDRDAS